MLNPLSRFMDRERLKILWRLLTLIGLAGLVALIAAWIWRWRRRWAVGVKESPAAPISLVERVEGLSEAEAAARRQPDVDNALLFKPPRSRKQIIRENAFTIFNLGLVGIIFVQLLLGKPLDALMSVGVLIFTVAVNVGQEEFARLRLRRLLQESRPKATVIRERKVRSIDAAEIVVGDMVAVGPGDLILVDGRVVGEGQLFVDESALFGGSGRVAKAAGDEVYAGGICLHGRAVIQTERVGSQRRAMARLQELEKAPQELTPIERTVQTVLRGLLVVVVLLVAFLLISYFRFDLPIENDKIIDAIGVIFSIAPAGLFFMIVLTYAGSTVDLAQLGVLVHRARSVESLAQLDVICFGKEGFLTGAQVELKSPPGRAQPSPLSEAKIRQIVGDFARSISLDNTLTQALQASFEGEKRDIVEESPFLAVHGWSAVVFDNDDLRGTYVLGEQTVLQPYLLEEMTEDREPEERQRPAIFKRAASWSGGLTRLLRRKDKTAQPSAGVAGKGERSQKGDPLAADLRREEKTSLLASGGRRSENELAAGEAGAKEAEPEDVGTRGRLLARIRREALRILPRGRTDQRNALEAEEMAVMDERRLLFAYLPLVERLQVGEELHLPQGLIPLAMLEYQEKIRPEAVEAVRIFAERGVEIKAFISDSTERSQTILRRVLRPLSLAAEESDVISASALSSLADNAFQEAVQSNVIFAGVTPTLAARVVQSLRERGMKVGVIGDGVSDIPAMMQADLAITTKDGSTAALSMADIVLLDRSPLVASKMIDKGQRIVNGLLNVLKLYLTQILYLLLLVLILLFTVRGFPYTGAQGGVIAAFTISVPGVAISLLARPGRPPMLRLGRLLAAFVLPAGLTIAMAGAAVYIIFVQRNDHAYAQVALTHALMVMGALLVTFIHPPWRWPLWRRPRAVDFAPALIAFLSLGLFVLITYIPLAQKLLKIHPLAFPLEYLFIVAVAMVWALLFVFLWLLIWLLSMAVTHGRRAVPRSLAPSSFFR
ncbi:MAG: HAD-IC family P-type ATPase [Chloroflexi bacterium]|nr:HAD-IC family P-type ATPase [Chloroflexota bacterium]